MTPFDLKRLESYAQNSLDYHVILDLLPTVASLYFEKRLGDGIRLSAIQSSLLLGMGLQRKTVEEVEARYILSTSLGFISYLLFMTGRAATSCFPSPCPFREIDP